VQIDPIKPTLKAPGTKRLKLQCDELLSDFAFDFNLRRYIELLRQFMDYSGWYDRKVGRCRLPL
jgi:hypothetical protein